jgi:soluble lytic murein transglycosylase-like protein
VLERLAEAQEALTARTGELQLARIELRRLQTVVDYSRRYHIPADLAASIHDIAISEGVDPRLAFSLVRVESGFSRGVVSSAGAVGLTQVMPTTAFELQPELQYPDLFERETNLRLGFRYLRKMLQQFNGDLHLALLAYNRGPGTVEEIRITGGDPSNGYSTAVIGGARLAGKARTPGKP